MCGAHGPSLRAPQPPSDMGAPNRVMLWYFGNPSPSPPRPQKKYGHVQNKRRSKQEELKKIWDSRSCLERWSSSLFTKSATHAFEIQVSSVVAGVPRRFCNHEYGGSPSPQQPAPSPTPTKTKYEIQPDENGPWRGTGHHRFALC